MKGTSGGCGLALPALIAVVAAAVSAGCEPATDGSRGTDNGVAERIVTLSPHLTELVYSAGAGDRLVGVVQYSDYPEAARALPRVGDAFRIDLEAVAALSPDLILAWRSGNPRDTRDGLRELGYRVVDIEPRRLEDVAAHIRLIGELAGTQAAAEQAARRYESRLEGLRARYRDARPIDVFYQVADRPLVTVSGGHVISQAIELCGGVNVFAGLPSLTPTITREAVLDSAPEVIIASRPDGQDAVAGLRSWAEWNTLPAVAAGNLYSVNADYLSRATTRLIGGIRQICEVLDTARVKASH